MATTTVKWTVAQVAELLENVPIFQGLPRTDLEHIAGLVRGRGVAAGEMIFMEGDAGDKFYIVFDGCVEVLKKRGREGEERVALKRAGEAFGEMSLLNDMPRSASVRAVEDTQLLVVTRDQFDDLIGGETLAVRIMRGLARSLRALDLRLASTTQRGRPDSPATDVLRQFCQTVQNGLLPRQAPQVEGFDIITATSNDEGFRDPLAEASTAQGDALWDACMMRDGQTLVSVLNVKGEGLPTAYLLGVARALVRKAAKEETELGRLLTRANEAVAENMFEGLDECVEAGLLSLGPSTATFSGAGDQPLYVLRAGGEKERLAPHGPPLGILPHFDYATTQLTLAPGDILFLFSGAPAGLVEGAADLVLANRSAAPARIMKLLEKALQKVGLSKTDQDMMLLIAKRT